MSRCPSRQVAALKIADEAFLVATTIERCPKTMMIRELFMNAVEAAVQALPGEQLIEIKPKEVGGIPKLCIWNTGPGMSDQQLHMVCDLASSIGKDKGLDENFGMGAKVASLPSNRHGLRYRSCRRGIVSEIILGERNGVYGRLRRELDGEISEVIDVTEVCKTEGEYDLQRDWTEVVLFGNRTSQNTVQDPYDGNPAVTGQWLADYLYHRFFRLPAGLIVRFLPGAHKLGGGMRTFRTIPDRAFPMGRSQTVVCPDGIRVHYFYDPPLKDTSHNKSISGAITTDVSVCTLVYKSEIYDLKRGRQWTFDAPIYGIPFGPKHISVHIELPDDAMVRPEAYRQFLRYRDGDQRQVQVQDFADIARENRPEWLIEIINSLAPSDAGNTEEIRDELQKLLNALRVRNRGPKIDPNGGITIENGAGTGAGSGAGHSLEEGGAPRTGGQRPGTIPEDLIAAPAGARRACLSKNNERAPEIIPLHDAAMIEEKGLKGKAAKFYPEASQLFVNMNYSSVGEMRAQLETEYAAAQDPEIMRRMALELAERTMTIRVGRAVVFALAKQLNREWTIEDMQRAQSPESLSLAADDFADALQNARRRMGQALRTPRQDNASRRGELQTLEGAMQ